jgi:hypothetical protein
MSLSGLKSLLGNTSDLLRSDTAESPRRTGLQDSFLKNKTGDLPLTSASYDNSAMEAVTSRFVEAQNTNSLTASNSPKLYSAERSSSQTPTPKAIIIPLKAGSKSATYDELSRSVVRATLEQNGIEPSNLEMEEIMALPQNRNIDMNVRFDRNWKVYDLPGSMPSPGKFTDASGRQVFGYGMTLSPDWQAQTVEAYKQVRGELAKPENVNRKAVVDMKMTERLKETVKIAWEKGYISDEVKNQLGNITPEELAAAFTIGGVIGIIGTTEAGAAALGPVGSAIGLAYTINQMAKFDHIADGAARATNRQQLDKPAQEFGAFLGSLSKDGVLALVGMAGGAIAPRTMPQVEAALTNKVGNVRQILKEGLPKLEEPRPATANGAPVETTNAKLPTSKTALENNEPLEMRAGKSTAGNRRFEEAMRQKHLPEGTAKVLSGDELTQAAKITNRPAADQIAFVKSGKGYKAVITEITEGDKSITHLSDQLRGGKIIAQSDKDYGIQTTNFIYRIVTNNEKLYRAIKADKAFQNEFRGRLEVIFEGRRK